MKNYSYLKIFIGALMFLITIASATAWIDTFETTNPGAWTNYAATRENTYFKNGAWGLFVNGQNDNTSLGSITGTVNIRMWYYFVAGGGAADPYFYMKNSGGTMMLAVEGGDGGDDTLGAYTGSGWTTFTDSKATGVWKYLNITYDITAGSCVIVVSNATMMTKTTMADCQYGGSNDNVDDFIIVNQGAASFYVDDLQVCSGSCGETSSSPTYSITVTNLGPANNTFNSSNLYNFAYNNSVIGYNITGCTLYLNGTANASNASAIVVNGTNYINSITIPDGSYKWGVGCSNGSSVTYSTNFTLTADTVAPTITTDLTSYYTNFMALNITTNDTNPQNFTVKSSCNLNFSNNSVTATSYKYSVYLNISNCTLGTHSTNITAIDKANNSIFSSYTWTNQAAINITATSAVTASAIASFNISFNGTYIGSAGLGYLWLTNVTPGVYNVTINATGYELKSAIININQTVNSYSFSLYTTNSLTVYVRDEETGAAIISQNITYKFTSTLGEFTNITNTSTLYIDNLNATEYNLLISTENYTSRAYTLTIGDRTTQTLNAYLAKTASISTTLFTITDRDTSTVLEGALASMYRFINGSWVPVESKYTDITGKVQFSYVALTNYKFYLSKSGYTDYVFYLNPILFATYDIKMSKSTSINYSQDYDKLAVIYAPSYFRNGTDNIFNFIISAPYGNLQGYGITLTYPGGTVSTTGSNAIGGQLTLNFTPSAVNFFDTVTLDYYYITTLSGRRNFTIPLPIVYNVTGTDYTFMANKDRTYGLGIFERVLIATLIVLMVVGIATMIGQPIPGLALGLFVFGYIAYIGFIPLWAILPSMFVGTIFLIWKSGGY